MTIEETNLLFQDICGRLQYGVKAKVYGWDEENGEVEIPLKIYSINTDGYVQFEANDYDVNYLAVDDCLLYLRPLSSMTEEEKKELSKKYVWNIWAEQIQIRYHSQGCWDDETECPTEEYIELFNWLNKKMFDYRGLIPMGIAIEAPEDMYNTKIK